MIVVAGPRIDSAGLPGYNGLKVRAYAPTCTGTWPPATWQSCKAVSPPAWNSSTPPAVSLLPPRSPLRADLPTSPTPRPLPSGPPDGLRRQRPPTPSPPRSAAPSTTVRSRPTAPPRCPPHRRTSVSTRLGARTSTARPCGSTADDSPGHESLRPLPDRRKPLPSLVALVAVTASTRSYAFSDRCALGDPQQQPGSEGMADKRFRRSTTVLWTWLDLNQRPHPYQVSRAKRCAGRRFPRSPVSVKGEGMRS
jgi:hypothetical protein